MALANGCIRLPKGPSLGVEIDRDNLAQYVEYFRGVGGYPHDRYPARPDCKSV